MHYRQQNKSYNINVGIEDENKENRVGVEESSTEAVSEVFVSVKRKGGRSRKQPPPTELPATTVVLPLPSILIGKLLEVTISADCVTELNAHTMTDDPKETVTLTAEENDDKTDTLSDASFSSEEHNLPETDEELAVACRTTCGIRELQDPLLSQNDNLIVFVSADGHPLVR